MSTMVKIQNKMDLNTKQITKAVIISKKVNVLRARNVHLNMTGHLQILLRLVEEVSSVRSFTKIGVISSTEE